MVCKGVAFAGWVREGSALLMAQPLAQRNTSAVPRSFGSGPNRFGPELLSRQ